MVFDIDNFKAINDVYGHTMGDHTISIISSLIASQFSGSEIVGRIGGDEFVVFSQNVSSQTELYCKIDELLSIIAVKENLSIPDNVTVSIGLAFSDPQDTHYDTLFANFRRGRPWSGAFGVCGKASSRNHSGGCDMPRGLYGANPFCCIPCLYQRSAVHTTGSHPIKAPHCRTRKNKHRSFKLLCLSFRTVIIALLTSAGCAWSAGGPLMCHGSSLRFLPDGMQTTLPHSGIYVLPA